MRFPVLALVLAATAASAAPMTSPLRELAAAPPEVRERVLAQLSDADLAAFERQTEPLGTFIERISPKYSAPQHLQPLVEVLEEARDSEMEVVVHAPPRHTKTETILHAIAQMVSLDPARTNAYVTYAQALAQSKSRKARMLASAAGVELAEDAQRLEEWRTAEGGGLLATGVGGPLTGHGVDGLLIVDDPFKNRVEAESETTRAKVWDWFNDVAYTRKEPGASVVVVATRWHPQDLSGKLVTEKGWRYVKLPALDVDGHALWPARFPVAELEKIREQVGEYTWTSLYQGEPRSRGGAVFGDVRTYDRAPTLGYRIALGIDCAYSAKTHADYSVCIALAEYEGLYYVLDVQRRQIQAPAFGAQVAATQKVRGKPQTRWYYAGPELGVAQLLTAAGVENLHAVSAKSDKFVRAQPVAAAWNAGKVLVPANAPWLDAFVAEVAGFTGVDDDQDDQVDALAAAYDELNRATASFDGLSLPRAARRI
jgi:predicted phage terminase large subunit-like protein